tara:strand:- start:690 stop:1475 length:786 start_codon:yes stop_codon:yes gene_type:complete
LDGKFITCKAKKKIHSYDLKNSGSGFITPFTTNNAISGIIDNKLFFYGFPELNSNDPQYFNKAKIGQRLDLISGNSIVGGGYPSSYFNHTYPGVSLLFNDQIVYKDKIIQSYALSDSIYFFNKDFIFEKALKVYSPTQSPPSLYDHKIPEKESEKAYFDFYRSKGYGSMVIFNENILLRKFYYSNADADSFKSFQEYEKTIQVGFIIYDLENESTIGIVKPTPEEIDQYPMVIANKGNIYVSKENQDEAEVDFYQLTWEEN